MKAADQSQSAKIQLVSTNAQLISIKYQNSSQHEIQKAISSSLYYKLHDSYNLISNSLCYKTTQ